MIKAKKAIPFLFILLLIAVFPLSAAAADELTVTVTTSITCDQVDFTIVVEGGSAPYTVVDLDFGDEESYQTTGETESTIQISHAYPSQGEWEWEITLQDDDELFGETEGSVTLEGPSVTLTSDPSPPLLTLVSGEASAEFTAEASGGTVPYTYSWDLDDDGSPDVGLEGDIESQTYTEGGKYEAEVVVTDACGFSARDTLKVIVIDPADEDACHPTALKIAEAVSSIFPDRAEQTYTCEDIFDIFNGGVFGYQVGFGRMWHAYQLTQTIDDLTWEEIRDWQLNYGGWGLLVQLNRFGDLLDTYGVRDLMDLVISGEQSVGDIRTAVRSVLRYEADFEDALQRINDGANPGELGQFYKLASDLDVDPTVLDDYMAEGLTLSELRHAAKFSERVGAEWSEIVEAKAFDHSWGEIGQAYRLADGDNSAVDILVIGIQEYRAGQREDARTEREDENVAGEEERTLRTAERLADQFGIDDVNEVMTLFDECEGSWGCVRKALRDGGGAQATAASESEIRTATQIASKYSKNGVTEDAVWGVFVDCGEDWSCVRAHYRGLFSGGRGKGRKK